MRLVRFPASPDVDTAVHQLPEPDLVVDPRPVFKTRDNHEIYADKYKFKVTVNGNTLTITRIDPPEYRPQHYVYPFYDPVARRWEPHWKFVREGWYENLRFRVYNSNEERYSFESTEYLYYGLYRERAPADVTEIIVKDGVKSVRREACSFLESLRAVFIPPTVKQIRNGAFEGCTSLRILNIPDSVEHIGYEVDSSVEHDVRWSFIAGCNSLVTDEIAEATREEKIEWLRNRYNPLHNLCCQMSVTPQAITQHIQDNNSNEERDRTNDKPQFTALHLLAANPSVTGDMITAYLQLAPDVAVMQDDIGMTPLHMLCTHAYFSDTTVSAIRAYLAFEKGIEVAFMMTDSQGKTPVQYLYEKTFDEFPLLKEGNKSIGGLLCSLMF